MSPAAASRSPAAIAFVVGGGALLLGLLSLATEFSEYQRWLYILASAGLSAALILLARGDIAAGRARAAVLTAGVAWGVFAVISIVPTLPIVLFTIAQLAVLSTSAVAGFLVVSRRAIKPRLAFAAMAGLSVLYMATYLFGITGRLAALVTAALGFGAISLGYFLFTRR